MSGIKTGSSTRKVKKPKTFNASLVANTDNLHLRVRVLKGEKEIYNERANSLLGSFSGLMGLWFGLAEHRSTDRPYMSNELYVPNANNYILCCRSASGGHPSTPQHPEPNPIVSWPAADEVRVSHATNTMARGAVMQGRKILIRGPVHAGLYTVLEATNMTTSQSVLKLDGLVSDPADSTDGHIIPFVGFNPRPYGQTDSKIGRINRIYVGGSTEPVKLTDPWLHNPHALDDFTGYDASMTAPVIAVNQSRMAITAQFTNVSGVEKSISEVGLSVHLFSHSSIGNDGLTNQGTIYLNREGTSHAIGWASNLTMIARDVVTTFPVAPAESFTVIYEIVSSINQELTSGVVAAFNECLYRQLANVNRVARGYWNVDHNTNHTSYQFNITENRVPRFENSVFGPIFGAEETDVDIDDYFLRNISNGHSRIAHGIEDGRLFYYDPRVVETVQSDTEAYHVVERLVENRGSVNVVAKQIGLVSASGGQQEHPVLLTHDIIPVADQITFEPGDIYRIRYKIGVALNS